MATSKLERGGKTQPRHALRGLVDICEESLKTRQGGGYGMADDPQDLGYSSLYLYLFYCPLL